MRAIVKNIAYGIKVKDENHSDEFAMDELIGKTIEVFPKRGCPNWFVNTTTDETEDDYNWHKDWLEFEGEP